jgi:hypothetical protein
LRRFFPAAEGLHRNCRHAAAEFRSGELKRIVRFLMKVLAAAIVATALAYAGDILVARYELSRHRAAELETAQVRRLYAIQQKDGKYSLSFGDPESQTCIHSLFPQFNYQPCWYTHRENKKPVFL